MIDLIIVFKIETINLLVNQLGTNANGMFEPNLTVQGKYRWLLCQVSKYHTILKSLKRLNIYPRSSMNRISLDATDSWNIQDRSLNIVSSDSQRSWNPGGVKFWSTMVRSVLKTRLVTLLNKLFVLGYPSLLIKATLVLWYKYSVYFWVLSTWPTCHWKINENLKCLLRIFEFWVHFFP